MKQRDAYSLFLLKFVFLILKTYYKEHIFTAFQELLSTHVCSCNVSWWMLNPGGCTSARKGPAATVRARCGTVQKSVLSIACKNAVMIRCEHSIILNLHFRLNGCATLLTGSATKIDWHQDDHTDLYTVSAHQVARFPV